MFALLPFLALPPLLLAVSIYGVITKTSAVSHVTAAAVRAGLSKLGYSADGKEDGHSAVGVEAFSGGMRPT